MSKMAFENVGEIMSRKENNDIIDVGTRQTDRKWLVNELADQDHPLPLEQCIWHRACMHYNSALLLAGAGRLQEVR